MKSQNADKVIDYLVSKSGFLEGNDWLVQLARKGAKGVIKQSIVDDPRDKLDAQGNYIPNKYDSLFFNAVFKDTHDTKDLYTTQQVVEKEEVVYCEESYKTLDFSRIEQSLGVGLAHIAGSVRDIYDERVAEGPAQISDFALHKIDERLGGLKDMDFIQKPTASRRDEVPAVKVHRKITNTLLDSLMTNDDRVLIVGGDGGSGSKRKRGYAIDCLYYTEKSFKNAKENRRIFCGRGEDFMYEEGFISSLPSDKYKVVMFNYCARRDIISEIVSKYKDTNVVVFGLVCDPKMDTDSRIRTFLVDKDLISYVKEMQEGVKNKYGRGTYGVLAVSPSKTAVYTDHGIFIDDRWRDRFNFVSFNRKELMVKLNLSGTYDGIQHGSLKVLKNAKPFIESLSFRISDDDYNNVVDSMRIYKVLDNKIYDENGDLYYPYTTLPDSRLACYRSSKDKKMKFFDIDIPGPYWTRRFKISESNVPLDSGSGLVVSVQHQFGSVPVFHHTSHEKMQIVYDKFMSVVDKEYVSSDIVMPTMFMKGFYYNPLLSRWIYDAEFCAPYVVIDSDTPPDGGIDLLIESGQSESRGDRLCDPVQIEPDMYVRHVLVRQKGSSYLRMYNYESTKMPLDSFCIDAPESEELFTGVYDTYCFGDESIPSDVFGAIDGFFGGKT
jgi:hypothetical protein